MGDELKLLLKGGWAYFQELMIFFLRPPHMQLVLPYLCMHVLSLQCFFVSAFICWSLLLHIPASSVLLALK